MNLYTLFFTNLHRSLLLAILCQLIGPCQAVGSLKSIWSFEVVGSFEIIGSLEQFGQYGSTFKTVESIETLDPWNRSAIKL